MDLKRLYAVLVGICLNYSHGNQEVAHPNCDLVRDILPVFIPNKLEISFDLQKLPYFSFLHPSASLDSQEFVFRGETRPPPPLYLFVWRFYLGLKHKTF